MPILNQTVHHASGTYVAGTELARTHELFRAAPELFEAEAPPVEAPPVEAATAAPGEKRSTRRPPKGPRGPNPGA